MSKKNPTLAHITFTETHERSAFTATATVDIPLTYELLTDILSLITEGSIDYWGELCHEADEYEAARDYIRKQYEMGKIEPAFGNELCYEDVLAGILIMGKKLSIWDREEDKDHYFDLQTLCQSIASYFTDNQDADYDPDTWDACTGDGIAQYICFDEWVYG